jgi:hypothetical protein
VLCKEQCMQLITIHATTMTTCVLIHSNRTECDISTIEQTLEVVVIRHAVVRRWRYHSPTLTKWGMVPLPHPMHQRSYLCELQEADIPQCR